MNFQGHSQTSKFNNVSPHEMAKALFEATGGNRLKLLSRLTTNPTAIWGKACEILFPGQEITNQDRYWLMIAYLEDRKKLHQLFDHHVETNKKKPSKSQKSQRSQKSQDVPIEQDLKIHCFCTRTYKESKSMPMVKCDDCGQILHSLCSGISGETYSEGKHYTCGLCTGDLVIPNLFEQTVASEKLSGDTPLDEKILDNKRTSLDKPTPKDDNEQTFSDISDDEFNSQTPKSKKDDINETITTIKSDGDNTDPGVVSSDERNLKTNPRSRVIKTPSPTKSSSDLAKYDTPKNSGMDSQEQQLTKWQRSPVKTSTPIGGKPIAKNVSLKKSPTLNFGLGGSRLSLLHRRRKTPAITAGTAGAESSSDDEWESHATTEERETKNDKREKPGSKPIREDSFDFFVPYDEWKAYLEKKERVVCGRVIAKEWLCTSKEYTNSFDDYYRHAKRTCVLAFNRKRVNPQPKSGSFLKAYAHCSHKACTASWTFTVNKLPKAGERIRVHVALSGGEVDHSEEDIAFRRYHGKKLEDLQEALKVRKPLAERQRRFANADVDLLEDGNYTEVGSLHAMQHVSSKEKAKNDLDKDVVHDVLLTMRQMEEEHDDKNVPGYIRFVGARPAVILMYSRMQLDLLKLCVQKERNVTLQLDGTGAMFNAFGKPYDDKDTILYTLVKRSPVGGVPVPLLEFILGDSSVPTLYFCLYHFFNKLRGVAGVTRKYYGITTIECDFSKALIGCVNFLFNQCLVAETLVKFWKRMTNESDEEIFPIHICRFHMRNTLRDKVKGFFKPMSQDTEQALKIWSARLLKSKDLYSFHKLVTDISNLCAMKYDSEDVQDTIEALLQPTDRSGEAPWLTFVPNYNDTLTDPLYKASPFGQYASRIIDKALIENARIEAKSKEDDERNPFFSHEFLEYLRVHVLHYFPIISHAVFDILDVPSTDDTTNVIEGYHNILKNNIHQGSSRQRVSRFLRTQWEFVRGTVVNYKLDLQKQKSSRKSKSSQNQSQDLGGHSPSREHSSSDTERQDGIEKEKKKKAWVVGSDKGPGLDSSVAGLDREKKQTQEGKHSSSGSSQQHDKLPKDPEADKDRFVKKKPATRVKISTAFQLDLAIVPYGGEIVVDNEIIEITNTCNFDTTMQILYFLFSKCHEFKVFLQTRAQHHEHDNHIYKCLEMIDEGYFMTAKRVWILDVLGHPEISENMIGSERNNGFNAIGHIFPLKKRYVCKNPECEQFDLVSHSRYKNDSKPVVSDSYTVLDITGQTCPEMLQRLSYLNEEPIRCRACNENYFCGYDFNFEHPLMMYCIDSGMYQTTEINLPMTQTIHGQEYKVICYTMQHDLRDGYVVEHFTANVVFRDTIFCLDGMAKSPKKIFKKRDRVLTSVWLLRSDKTID